MTIGYMAVSVIAIFIPVFFCAGFYYGFNIAQSVFVNRTVQKEDIPFAELWAGKEYRVENALYTETSRQRMARILAENVENFGTSVPQKEVE